MALEVRLPELADGVDTGEIVRWLVAVGDTVAAGQAVVEIEHEEGTTTIAAPRAGRIHCLHAEPGQCMRKDILLFEIE
ncbi:MAG: biotin/lipoyl-containing protein [Planctomycetia bacterium]|jgi:pyruvate dehydrogenase E2 component (dihydrolipoamide acetyltransferase)